jgi:hypothetical protein
LVGAHLQCAAAKAYIIGRRNRRSPCAIEA